MSVTVSPAPVVDQWHDEQTGRLVRQLTALPGGAELDYFRFPKQIPGGLILANGKHATGEYVAVDPERGTARELPVAGRYLKLNERTGQAWFMQDRRLVTAMLAAGLVEILAELPADLSGTPTDVTCDGRYLLLLDTIQDSKKYPPPYTKDAEAVWRWLHRPRRSRLWAWEIATDNRRLLAETEGVAICHVDTSPTDPTLIRYAEDSFATLFQRIWTVRLDGQPPMPIRRQRERDMVMHEFWWPGGDLIAYKYQFRNDETFHDLPWAEYAPVPTHFCLASLDGVERYRSAPINNWHTHIFVSPDGTQLCGEGTDGDSFVYAARFSSDCPEVRFVRQATIHTPYAPMAGQRVNALFSADGRWLVYNDRRGETMQVCAVQVEIGG